MDLTVSNIGAAATFIVSSGASVPLSIQLRTKKE